MMKHFTSVINSTDVIYWTDLDYELLLMLNQLILIVILVVRK